MPTLLLTLPRHSLRLWLLQVHVLSSTTYFSEERSRKFSHPILYAPNIAQATTFRCARRLSAAERQRQQLPPLSLDQGVGVSIVRPAAIWTPTQVNFDELVEQSITPEAVRRATTESSQDDLATRITAAIRAAAERNIKTTSGGARRVPKSYWPDVMHLKKDVQKARRAWLDNKSSDERFHSWCRAHTRFERACRRHERINEVKHFVDACAASSQSGTWRALASIRNGRRQLAGIVGGVSGQDGIATAMASRFASVSA